jgi:chemotaxis protein MotB
MTTGGGKKIVIVRRKGASHGGHHGGSWKVAYADFVTAMMAFFMVMWIMGMDQGVKDMVQGYFTNPVGFKKSFSGGTNALGAGNFVTNLEVKRTVILNRREQEESFRDAAEEIRSLMEADSLLGGLSAQVEIVVTEEGLRIELMEGPEGTAFFDVSSATLKPALRAVLALVGGVLDHVPGDVVVEGHTDALRYGGPGYSNWDLSVDRANSARREMEAAGLGEGRVAEVRGYADRRLKVVGDPLDARNRRISVLLPFTREATGQVAARTPAAPVGAGLAAGGG